MMLLAQKLNNTLRTPAKSGRGSEPFAYASPVALLRRILEVTMDLCDSVLNPFAGPTPRRKPPGRSAIHRSRLRNS